MSQKRHPNYSDINIHAFDINPRSNPEAVSRAVSDALPLGIGAISIAGLSHDLSDEYGRSFPKKMGAKRYVNHPAQLIDAVDAASAEVHAPRGARIARIGRRPVKAGNRRPEDRVDARCDVAASRRCPIVDAAGGVNVILLPESSSLVGGRDRDCRERVRLIDGRAGRVTPICDP